MILDMLFGTINEQVCTPVGCVPLAALADEQSVWWGLCDRYLHPCPYVGGKYRDDLPTSKANPGEAFTISAGRNRTSGDPGCVVPAISTTERFYSNGFVDVMRNLQSR